MPKFKLISSLQWLNREKSVCLMYVNLVNVLQHFTDKVMHMALYIYIFQFHVF